MEKYIEIFACCYSEKSDASIGFGIGFDSEDGVIDFEETNWIFEGMGDSFWENHFEFESGIQQAEALMDTNPKLTLRDALFAVFGHFEISYEVNGEETELPYNIDIDAAMYDLLAT